MKFGQRIQRESQGAASSGWTEHFIDYAQLKLLIKDGRAESFVTELSVQVEKAGTLFQTQAYILQHALTTLDERTERQSGCGRLVELKTDAAKLQKFQVLNYLAVVKAVKKYNRWLAPQVGRLSATAFLENAAFSTSLQLAHVKTRLDVMESELSGAPVRAVDQEREKYTCPICLSMLRQPVALSCSHLFCWGCLLSLTTSVSLTASVGEDGDPISDAKECHGERGVTAPPLAHTTFKCPCCRKEELLDLDRLLVDPVLDEYLMKIRSEEEAEEEAMMDTSGLEGDGASPGLPALLPPQGIEFRNKLTLCLDLDGTLVTTVNPRRAPALPESMVTYTVGKGGKLNPGGIFVIERPGLGDFLKRAACLCEVVLFTAGLEDYARPILDEMERRYGRVFHHRLYRDATTVHPLYPCVKDMSRLGRDLQRCILVDDTPLTFLKQPDHGVPVLQYRGDADDRLLPEAVEPLLFRLLKEKDVPKALRRRFNMSSWFESQGMLDVEVATGEDKVEEAKKAVRSIRITADSSSHLVRRDEAIHAHIAPHEVMLVADFDQTITDFDAAERLCDELCPELTSLLSAVEELACYVPMTNTVLSEMHRRGVSRDAIVRTLTKMGAEVPDGSRRLVRTARVKGIEVRVLSDANETFIGHILAGARIRSCFAEVVTNHASWGPDAKLAVKARSDHTGCDNGCPRNLCKGRELSSMIARRMRQTKRVVYIGDGANDFCGVLSLGPNDIALARNGFPLADRIMRDPAAVRCHVAFWDSHDDLPGLLKEFVD